jgi:hypothetical protein
LTFDGEVLDGKMLLSVVENEPYSLGVISWGFRVVFGFNFLDLLLFLFRLVIFELLDFRFALLLGLFFFVTLNFL